MSIRNKIEQNLTLRSSVQDGIYIVVDRELGSSKFNSLVYEQTWMQVRQQTYNQLWVSVYRGINERWETGNT